MLDPHGRPVDGIGRRYPRNPTATALQLFRAVPQLGSAFARAPRVPATHLERDSIRCPCGSTPTVLTGQIGECTGRCGRWFLRVAYDDVRALTIAEVQTA